MKKPLRLLSAFLCIALIFSFSACQVEKTPSETTVEPSSQGITSAPASAQTTVAPHSVDSNSFGSAVGAMFREQMAELSSFTPEFFQYAGNQEALSNVKIDADFVASLNIPSLDEEIAMLLQGIAARFQVETQEDAAYFSLDADFEAYDNSAFTLEGLLLDETDFYIALPQYLDSVVRIPLDAASFAEEDFYPAPAIEQIDHENAAALLNACTALLGDCAEVAFASIPDEHCSMTESSIVYAGAERPIQQLTVDLNADVQYQIVKSVIEYLPDSSSFSTLLDLLIPYLMQSGEFPADLSADEAKTELYDSLSEAAEELDENTFESDVPLELAVSFDDDRLYGCRFTMADGTGDFSMEITFSDTMTETDGEFTLTVDFHSEYEAFSLLYSSERAADGALNSIFQLSGTDGYGDTLLDLSVYSQTYLEEDGSEVCAFSFALDTAEISLGASLALRSHLSEDGYEIQLSLTDLYLSSYDTDVLTGEMSLDMYISENTEYTPYNIEDAVDFETLINDQASMDQFLYRLMENPALAVILTALAGA